MTPSSSVAVKVVSRPGRVASFFLKSMWAGFVFGCVCLLWLLLFILFLPFLVVGELLGLKSRIGSGDGEIAHTNCAGTASLAANESESEGQFIFDRRKDVSKLFGCNTRNVQYRWSIFSNRLIDIKNKHKEPEALDFGAGSLRDSFELTKLGFKVLSVDLDKRLLEQYYSSYAWEEAVSAPPPRLFTEPLDNLLQQSGPNRFHLAIAFDVIEHLEDPADTVGKIHSLLDEQGLLFTIVPNRRNLFERYTKYNIRKLREKKASWIPGVPHLQFKDPDEWDEFFKDNGFDILEHDMTIGFFVNNLWSGLLGLPLRIWVSPVMAMLAHLFHLRFNAAAFERAFSPPWLMERVNVWDVMLKEKLLDRFGWNLIVAQRKP